CLGLEATAPPPDDRACGGHHLSRPASAWDTAPPEPNGSGGAVAWGRRRIDRGHDRLVSTSRTEERSMNTPETDLHREVHGDLRAPGPEPVLLLAGFPMGGGGFRGLAERMSADRVVVTYDPRGVGRSVRAEGDDRLL